MIIMARRKVPKWLRDGKAPPKSANKSIPVVEDGKVVGHLRVKYKKKK